MSRNKHSRSEIFAIHIFHELFVFRATKFLCNSTNEMVLDRVNVQEQKSHMKTGLTVERHAEAFIMYKHCKTQCYT